MASYQNFGDEQSQGKSIGQGIGKVLLIWDALKQRRKEEARQKVADDRDAKRFEMEQAKALREGQAFDSDKAAAEIARRKAQADADKAVLDLGNVKRLDHLQRADGVGAVASSFTPPAVAAVKNDAARAAFNSGASKTLDLDLPAPDLSLPFAQQPPEVQKMLVEGFQANAPEGVRITPLDVQRELIRRQVELNPPDFTKLQPSQATMDVPGGKLTLERPPATTATPITKDDGSPTGQLLYGDRVISDPSAKATQPKLTEGEKALQVNMGEFDQTLNQLRNIILDYGNFESQLPDMLTSSAVGKHSGLTSNQAAGLMKSLMYRAAIQYSKIVDPATAAREGEVVAVQKYAIPMGLTTPNSATLAALDNMQAEAKRRMESNASIREQQGLPPVSLNTPVSAPGEIAVISPDGESGTIPESQWPEAEKLGYRRAQ